MVRRALEDRLRGRLLQVIRHAARFDGDGLDLDGGGLGGATPAAPTSAP